MKTFIAISFLLIIGKVSSSNWANELDGFLKFECPEAESISFIESLHDNDSEDRIWRFECGPVNGTFNSCSWSGEVNNLDEPLLFECQNGAGVITGMESDHDNDQEDRRWNFKCCTLEKMCYSECGFSSYVNDFDDPLEFRVDTGYYLTGAESIHDNKPEDRRWKYQTCQLAPCGQL
ncbi:hypothetical protein TCAL_05525 [Tigriopus californicus]|uniref:Uncharacterized protein n=1 Tax=Tigriopus californicus TaxID=6832 RepID=A0A553NPG8_TIGCA|nr:hemagglutinin/amebocyte aggregation factor-like [Tigriopus californicus]TRY67341.1 hypothetical protein TCAL_05525 [Tigriopus californicus]|eukprot:TCALIF_05525-PA protein Name:"Similar to Hemagglutinin/amebocyte aggregation factor (Limulus polyphemus)" AED:0.11 eAED:0.11 QI:56/1/1/1/0.66/0.5/4/176/176